MSELQDSDRLFSEKLILFSSMYGNSGNMEVHFTQAAAGKAGLSLLLHESPLDQSLKQQNKLTFQQKNKNTQ